MIAVEGVVTDNAGLVMAFSKAVTCELGSSTWAEAEALRMGLQIALNYNVVVSEIESDSSLLVQANLGKDTE